jgi:peptidoglycan hydrolase-like protein with peptidoglycan-binding domain
VVPAKTRSIQRRVLAAPATVEQVGTEATYRNVTTRQLVSPESLQWREILCETNASPEVIRRLQQALRERGFYQGSIDGNFGPSTTSAVTRYQRSSGEGTGGLTMDTLGSLGIEIR